VTVYDGADGDCLPLKALQERRNGKHTSDDSGDISVYTLDGSGRGDMQCYTSISNFTVSVCACAQFLPVFFWGGGEGLRFGIALRKRTMGTKEEQRAVARVRPHR
jgi:hypothetical protein